MDPGSRIDGYRLEGEIARGAFGTIFRARGDAGRQFALKLLTGRLDERSRERFLREGQVTASLDHPGIVRVFGCGQSAGQPYLVYELIEGGRTLRDLIPSQDPLALVPLVRDAARALGHAHHKAVIHRDVKPDNLLVDAQGRLLVADFGLAVAEGADRLTRTGEMVGTPHYMAPEQIDPSQREETPATDVWALGVVLYEALTGTVPFDASSMVELIAQVLRRKVPPPSRRADGISRALDAVCLRALQRDPQARFPDGAAMADALDQALMGKAPGPSLDPRLLGLVALVAFLVAGAVWLSQETRAVEENAPTPSTGAVLSKQDPLENARGALAADEPAEALAALSAAPAGPAVQLVRAEAHLSLGQIEPARSALAGLRSRDAERLLAFADLLAGDLNAASRRLKGSHELRALALEEERVELHGKLQETASLGWEDCRDQAMRLATRGAEVLPPLGPLGRELRGRLVDTLSEAALTVTAVTDRAELLPELDRMLQEARRLRPDMGPSADAARTWLWYYDTQRSRHPKVRELAQRDPRPILERIDERLHGVALGMHYLTRPPEHRRALQSMATQALTSTLPAGPVGVFRSELLAGLNVDQRRVAWEAFKQGDLARGKALLTPALKWSAELALTRSKLSRWPSSQCVYTFLMAGELERARGHAATMFQDLFIARYAKAEIEMAAGNPRQAYGLLSSGVEVPYPEALVAQAHCLLLLGEGSPEQIERLLERARTSTERRTGADWHAPEEFEHLRAGGWWPGKR